MIEWKDVKNCAILRTLDDDKFIGIELNLKFSESDFRKKILECNNGYRERGQKKYYEFNHAFEVEDLIRLEIKTKNYEEQKLFDYRDEHNKYIDDIDDAISYLENAKEIFNKYEK